MFGKRTKLILQRATQTVDGEGGFTTLWSDLCFVYGVLTTVTGNERIGHQKIEVLASLKFYCERLPNGIDITEKDQFKYGARLLEIKFIANPGELGYFHIIYLDELV